MEQDLTKDTRARVSSPAPKKLMKQQEAMEQDLTRDTMQSQGSSPVPMKLAKQQELQENAHPNVMEPASKAEMPLKGNAVAELCTPQLQAPTVVQDVTSLEEVSSQAKV